MLTSISFNAPTTVIQSGLTLATRHHFQPLERGFLQLLTVVRMCYTYELVCTLAKCFAEQIRNTVLCD